MEMHQIRYFLAVARTLNFTRAAEECNVAQPSLTRAIKNLEAELGGELFRRERASSHLTNLGRAMLPLLTHSHDSALAAKSQAEAFKAGDYSKVRITLSQTVDFDVVADAFAELERAFADIQLTFQRSNADDIVERLRSGDAEIALAGPVDDSWDRLDTFSLFAEDIRVVVNETHRLAGVTSVDPAELADERMILRPFCEEWRECRELLEASGVDIGHCHEVASDRDAIRLLEAGLGVGLLPASTRIGDNLRTIRLANPFERIIRIYAVAGRQRSPALNGLMNLLRAADWAQYEDLPAAG